MIVPAFVLQASPAQTTVAGGSANSPGKTIAADPTGLSGAIAKNAPAPDAIFANLLATALNVNKKMPATQADASGPTVPSNDGLAQSHTVEPKARSTKPKTAQSEMVQATPAAALVAAAANAPVPVSKASSPVIPSDDALASDNHDENLVIPTNNAPASDSKQTSHDVPDQMRPLVLAPKVPVTIFSPPRDINQTLTRPGSSPGQSKSPPSTAERGAAPVAALAALPATATPAQMVPRVATTPQSAAPPPSTPLAPPSVPPEAQFAQPPAARLPTNQLRGDESQKTTVLDAPAMPTNARTAAIPHIKAAPVAVANQGASQVVPFAASSVLAPSAPAGKSTISDVLAASTPTGKIGESDKLKQPAEYPRVSLQTLVRPTTSTVVESVAFSQFAKPADKEIDAQPDAPAQADARDWPVRPALSANQVRQDVSAAPAAAPGNYVGPSGNPSQSSPAPAVQVAHAIVGHAEVLRRDGETTLHLRLDPPGLGTVRVHLSATDQTVSARLVVQGESTRQLLESQAGMLRDKLMDSGMTLGRFAVSCDSGGGGAGGTWQQGTPTRNSGPATASTVRQAAGAIGLLTRAPQGLIDVVV